MKKLLLLTVLTIFYLFAMNKFLKLYLADVYSKNAGSFLGSGELEKALDYSSKAVKNNPQEPSYYREKAKILLATLILKDEPEMQTIKKETLDNLIVAQKLNYKNLATLRNEIPLYYFLTVRDISQPSGVENIDQTYLPLTKDYYETLKDTYPHDLGLLADIAEYEKKLFLKDDYQKTVEIVGTLRSDVLEWYPAFK